MKSDKIRLEEINYAIKDGTKERVRGYSVSDLHSMIENISRIIMEAEDYSLVGVGVNQAQTLFTKLNNAREVIRVRLRELADHELVEIGIGVANEHDVLFDHIVEEPYIPIGLDIQSTEVMDSNTISVEF